MQRNTFFKSREDKFEAILGEGDADMAEKMNSYFDSLENVRENFKPDAVTTQDKFSYHQDLINSFEAYRASENQEYNKFDKTNLFFRQVIGYKKEPKHLEESKPNFKK